MVLHPVRTGVAFGAFMGLWHLIWSMLVALGWAQAIIDFVLWMHFMKVPVTTAPFSLPTAAVLVAVTALIGFAAGTAFGALWNWVQRKA